MLRAKSSGKDSQETVRRQKNRNPQEPPTGYTEVTHNGSEILMLNNSFQEEHNTKNLYPYNWAKIIEYDTKSKAKKPKGKKH